MYVYQELASQLSHPPRQFIDTLMYTVVETLSLPWNENTRATDDSTFTDTEGFTLYKNRMEKIVFYVSTDP